MKKIQIAGLTALTLLGSLTTSQAQSATTDPVGYITINIKGHGGTSTQGITVPRISLVGQQEYSSSTSAFTRGATNILTDSSAAFAVGDYINNTHVSHYIEITSGPHAGTISWITASAGGTTLETNDDLSFIADNSSYTIRKAFTISDLFETIPTALTGAGSQSSADEVQILDASTGEYSSFWYKSAGLGVTGWQTTKSTATPPAEYALFPTDGILILRKQEADTSVVVTGSVKLSDTLTEIEGNGYNLLSPLVPVEQITPANSGLYTGLATTGLTAAGSQASADEILIYDPTSKSYISFWYKNTGLGETGWQVAGETTTILDPANYAFPKGSAIFVYRKAAQGFTWTMPKTFTGN